MTDSLMTALIHRVLNDLESATEDYEELIGMIKGLTRIVEGQAMVIQSLTRRVEKLEEELGVEREDPVM